MDPQPAICRTARGERVFFHHPDLCSRMVQCSRSVPTRSFQSGYAPHPGSDAVNSPLHGTDRLFPSSWSFGQGGGGIGRLTLFSRAVQEARAGLSSAPTPHPPRCVLRADRRRAVRSIRRSVPFRSLRHRCFAAAGVPLREPIAARSSSRDPRWRMSATVRCDVFPACNEKGLP